MCTTYFPHSFLFSFFFFPMGSGLGICWQAHEAGSAKKIKIEVGSDVFLTLESVTCHSTSAPDAFPPPLQGCVWSLERGVSHRCAPAALLDGTGQQVFSSQNKQKVKTIFFQKNCREKKGVYLPNFSVIYENYSEVASPHLPCTLVPPSTFVC